MFNVVCFYCIPVMPCLSKVLKNLFDLLYFILLIFSLCFLLCSLTRLSLSLLVAFITVHGSEPVDSSVYQHETTIATITTQNNRFDRSKAEARC